MTAEEANKYILDNWFDGNDSAKYCVNGDNEILAMKIASEALDNKIYYKWHDLTYDPYDLPKQLHDVEIAYESRFGSVRYTVGFIEKHENGIKWVLDIDLIYNPNILGWKEILPFNRNNI